MHITIASTGMDLLYRNQFVLGPRPASVPASWRRIQIDRTLCLTTHPDLPVHTLAREGKSITLLGFMLDPENENAKDKDIVEKLLAGLSSCDSFYQQTYRYGGRWILIVCDGSKTILFHDAAGLRQVFYTNQEYAAGLWCGTQPGLLARLLDLEMDSEALTLINSYHFRQNKEHWWPGNGSPYRAINHLSPNHALDLGTGRAFRYWPDRDLDVCPTDEAVEKISRTLQGMFRSAVNRFDLALSVTAGWDSRLLLAASRDVADRMSYMTVRQMSMRDNHPDVSVPAALLSELGLKHDVVQCSYLVDPEFVKIFKTNVPLAHDFYVTDAQAILNYFGLTKVAVMGGVSEIARDPTIGTERSIAGKITPREMSIELYNTGTNEYAIREIEKWRAGLGNLHNVDLDTILFWEQREGNWLAMNLVEFDIAWKDIFSPYNCRSLLIDMLAVDVRDRRAPGNRLYEKLALNLWPDVLRAPINPHKRRTWLRTVISSSRVQAKRLAYRYPLVRKWLGIDS